MAMDSLPQNTVERIERNTDANRNDNKQIVNLTDSEQTRPVFPLSDQNQLIPVDRGGGFSFGDAFKDRGEHSRHDLADDVSSGAGNNDGPVDGTGASADGTSQAAAEIASVSAGDSSQSGDSVAALEAGILSTETNILQSEVQMFSPGAAAGDSTAATGSTTSGSGDSSAATGSTTSGSGDSTAATGSTTSGSGDSSAATGSATSGSGDSSAPGSEGSATAATGSDSAGSGTDNSTTSTMSLEQQIIAQLDQIGQEIEQIGEELAQYFGDQSSTSGQSGNSGDTSGDSGTTGGGDGTTGTTSTSGTGGDGTAGTSGTGSDGTTGTTGASGNGDGGTTGGSGSGSDASTGGSGGTDSTGGTSNNNTVTNTSVLGLEQSDPALAATLNSAASQMSTTGFDNLQSFLATNNPTNNTNLDATLMSQAVTQGVLSQADAGVLQQAEIANMQPAQIMTYAEESDPSLYKTLSDVASSNISTQGWQQIENNLVNNYTGDQYMDSNLLNQTLNQTGLSSADQSDLTNVLQTDLPSALAADPFAAGLQASDPTMAQTLSDASSSLSSTGYQQLETYVEDNYTGQTTSDGTIMSNALTQANLSSTDSSALSQVLQKDIPDAGSTVSDTGSGSGSTGGSDSTSGSGSTSGSDSSSGSGSTGGSDSSSGSGSTSGSGSASGSGSTSGSDSGSAPANGAGENGGANSGKSIVIGGETILDPPDSSSGLVTPDGSLSGDDTAYQGTIQGTTTGANDVTPSTGTTGQGNGSEALELSPASFISSMNEKNGNGFSQKYGYFEADIKMSQTNGQVDPNMWPGWYLESTAHTLNPNGAPSAEIDVMEAQTSNTNGQGDTSYFAGVHRNSSDYGGGSIPDSDDGTYASNLPSISSGFNTYGVNWQPNDKNLEFYYDGKEIGYNPVYDTTDGSPVEMILDMGNGGWNSSDSSAKGGSMDVAWVRAYQNANLVNSTNDPNGTVGSQITDTNPDDSPPALTEVSDGGSSSQQVTWVNTFNTDFTQASDYTTNANDTTAVLPGAAIDQPTLNSNLISTQEGGAQNTPWYEDEWMVDQGTSTLKETSPGISTTPGANG